MMVCFAYKVSTTLAKWSSVDEVKVETHEEKPTESFSSWVGEKLTGKEYVGSSVCTSY